VSELAITLQRVVCEEVTDDFLEGLSDEIGWKLVARDSTGERVQRLGELPMPELELVTAGREYQVNRELARLGPEWVEAELEFWDKDTFSRDDLLGHVDIHRDGKGSFTVTPGITAHDLGHGAYRLTGEHGDYTVWLSFEERPS
jgi:hypothetical protein